jgi:hypothetical protein
MESVSLAQRSQENLFDRSRPRADSDRPIAGSVSTRSRAAAISPESVGSTNRAASPAISSRPLMSEVTIGVPQAMASVRGIGKASRLDG